MAYRAVFLDRDDTLIEDPGYIQNPDQVKLLEGVPEALNDLKALDYKLVVVSNQSGVARGLLSEEALAQIHDRLRQLLAGKGASLDNIYYCPYHPDGLIPQYSRLSEDRKPNPGMLLRAAQEMDIDLAESWMVGNNSHDVEAGRRAGCRTIRIDADPQPVQPGTDGPAPDFVAANLPEAADIIKRHHDAVAKSDVELAVWNADNGDSDSPTTAAMEPSPDEEYGQTQPREEPGPARSVQFVQLTQSPQPSQSQTEAASEELLKSILEQLRTMHRSTMFHEFSIMRLVAGVLQVIVWFCMLVALWFLVNPNIDYAALTVSLLFAAVFQLMALTFYIIRGLGRG